MIQPQPDPSAGMEFGDSTLVEFTDVAIPLPPGIKSRRPRPAYLPPPVPESPESAREQLERFQQISDEQLLALWQTAKCEPELIAAIIKESERRRVARGETPMTPELRAILGD